MSSKKEKKVLKEKKEVKVKFDKNINIAKNAPTKEKYPATDNLKLDDDELQKESEIENDDELQKETEADDDELQKETEGDDEDHELDDINDDLLGEDHEVDDVINDEVLEDDLYDNTPKIKSDKKKKIKIDTDKDDIEDDLCEYNYDEIYDEKKEEPVVIVENDKRITFPKLTKYEKVRLIGARAKQISLGAKVMVKNTKGLNPIEIAKLELEFKMIPMKIRRVLPNNNIEIWKLSELEQ